jgi:hypothetical protein
VDFFNRNPPVIMGGRALDPSEKPETPSLR